MESYDYTQKSTIDQGMGTEEIPLKPEFQTDQEHDSDKLIKDLAKSHKNGGSLTNEGKIHHRNLDKNYNNNNNNCKKNGEYYNDLNHYKASVSVPKVMG